MMRSKRLRWIVLSMFSVLLAVGGLLAIWGLPSLRQGGEAASTSSSNQDNVGVQETVTVEQHEANTDWPPIGGPGDKAQVQDSVDFIIRDSTGQVKTQQSIR